jgi:DNA-binding beta-propeller fold protein YncE
MGLPKGPDGIAISPDGRRASVTDAAASKVSVLSTRTGKVLARYATGTGPMHVALKVARFPGDVALSPDGAQAWVPAGGNQSRLVSALSTRTGAVIRRIRAGRFPAWVA